MVPGLVFDRKASNSAGGPSRIEKARIGLIQFQISPPKTDIEQSVVVSDYAQVGKRQRGAHTVGSSQRAVKPACSKTSMGSSQHGITPAWDQASVGSTQHMVK